jgi:hypothetical protein
MDATWSRINSTGALLALEAEAEADVRSVDQGRTNPMWYVLQCAVMIAVVWTGIYYSGRRIAICWGYWVSVRLGALPLPYVL